MKFYTPHTLTHSQTHKQTNNSVCSYSCVNQLDEKRGKY